MSRAREFADLAGSVDAGGVTGRNLIINGAMNIAQRGTSSTGTGYQTVDRYSIQNSGNVTQSQEDLSSSDTPYSHGFRKTLKLLNTSNSDAAGDYVQAFQIIEAQNVATSGWDYTSSSSFVTIQFWAKSSLAGTYVSFLRTNDGTARIFTNEFTLVADTWKKITYTVPGDSGLTINNDNGVGLELFVSPYYGSAYTTSGHTDEAWITYSSSDITGDFAQNWKNTSSATFFLTGVQLEVGQTATPFEHRSFGDELAKCQRYYEQLGPSNNNSGSSAYSYALTSYDGTGSNMWLTIDFAVTKRAAPTSLDLINGYSWAGTPAAFGYGTTGITMYRAGTSIISKSTSGTDNATVDVDSEL